MLTRKPIVAGSFYPSDVNDLNATVLSYLDNAVIDTKIKNILGVISPHAGYIFSGQCAAYSYKALSGKDFKTAIIIAPSHNFSSFKFSIGNYDQYQTPLGNIAVNKDISEKLLSDSNFIFFPEAHKYEHSLEVQLPFLQVINNQADIVPIIFGNQCLENAYILAEILAKIVKGILGEIVFIISSDLSHYYSSDIAKQKDLFLMNLLKERDEKALWESFLSKETEACGIGGILTLIILSKLLDYPAVSNLKYYHSGEINFDYSKVVGYASSVFYK